MTPTIIGLDYSLHNTSICVSQNFETFNFYTTFKPDTIKEVTFINKNKDVLGFDYTILSEDLFPKKPSYIDKERTRLKLYRTIADNVINYIKQLNIDPKSIIFALEGQSYNTKNTLSLVDIGQGTGIIKDRICSELLDGDVDRMLVYAPRELKATMGTGSSDKGVLFDAFLEDPKIDSVKDCQFYKGLQQFKSIIRTSKMIDKKVKPKKVKSKNGETVSTLSENTPTIVKVEKVEIASPYNDMIDAYLSVLKIYNQTKTTRP